MISFPFGAIQMVFVTVSWDRKNIIKWFVLYWISTKILFIQWKNKTQFSSLQNLTVIKISFDMVFVIDGYTEMGNRILWSNIKSEKKMCVAAAPQRSWPKNVGCSVRLFVYFLCPRHKNTRTTQTEHIKIDKSDFMPSFLHLQPHQIHLKYTKIDDGHTHCVSK